MSEEAGKQQFEINCASRGFHVYRNLWSPKFGKILQVKQDLGNVHDPFAISLEAKIPGKLTDFEVVGYFPREISRFCHYFLNYGGQLEARVKSTKYRPSPIPSGGLEIPILLVVRKGTSSSSVFRKMEHFIDEYYLEPDKIGVRTKQTENEEVDDDFEDEFVQETEESVERNSSTPDFVVAESLVPETEEVIREAEKEDNSNIVIPETIVID